MRKLLILLALAIVTVASTSGCSSSRCRNLFRRGSPCGGTSFATQPMLGGAIPLSNPVAFQQPPQVVVPQTIMAQPNCCCEQSAPMCMPCDPCSSGGYIGGSDCGSCENGSYMGGDCGCQTGTGEYFGGYVEGSAPPVGVINEGNVMPQGSGTYPGPVTGN